MSFLKFIEADTSESGKTKKWNITNTVGEKLGRIQWFSPWRKYVFDSYISDVVYDSNCLREIAEFLDSENIQHKETLKLAKQMSETKNEKTNSTPNPNKLQESN